MILDKIWHIKRNMIKCFTKFKSIVTISKSKNDVKIRYLFKIFQRVLITKWFDPHPTIVDKQTSSCGLN